MTHQEKRELDKWIHLNVMEGDKYVGLMKRGLWYRPDAKGYTDRQSEAWKLPREEAKEHEYPHDEPVTIREFQTPCYSTDPHEAFTVLQKCYQLDRNSCLASFHNFLMRKEHDTTLTELQVCLFAKDLYEELKSKGLLPK